jgi:hypothetical protein
VQIKAHFDVVNKALSAPVPEVSQTSDFVTQSGFWHTLSLHTDYINLIRNKISSNNLLRVLIYNNVP